MSSQVAVVAAACEFPEGRSPQELWATVLHGRRCFRALPPERLALADYTRADPAADGIYPIEAALLEGYRFGREAFRVPQPAFERTDMAHWLALDVATRALGSLDAASLAAERDSTAVIVANTLTGEFSRAQQMRYRWPYVERVLREAAADQLPPAALEALLQRVEPAYKAPFPAPDEDSLAGGLSNTIAGRIANHHGLRGGAHSVDGACAASLVAVVTACDRLAAGDVACVLVGAVDLSLDPFELVGFARNGALARELMRVFDARSDGFWPGEGCGFVLLARAEVAARHRWPVLAWIRGAAMSSDGQGGLTRPSVEGQLLAAQRAWTGARLDPLQADYFEAHGTGTATGDLVELQGLAGLFGDATPPRPVPIGSIKAHIGHTKAAAGMAGLLKAMAICSERVIPPTSGCSQPHPLLQSALAARLEVRLRAEAVTHPRPVTVGVSSFGFGGVNCHVVIQGDAAATAAPRSGIAWPEVDTAALPGELFTLQASSREGLIARLQQLAQRAQTLSRAQVGDLAHTFCSDDGPGWRAGLVAATPHELQVAAHEAAASLQSEAVPAPLSAAAALQLGERWAWSAPRARPPRIALLFPGQGNALQVSCRPWVQRFPALAEHALQVDRLARQDLADTAVVQPLLAELALAGLQLLGQVELGPALAFGHSFGDLCALHAGGHFGADDLRALAGARRFLMRELAPAGAMLSLQAPLDVVLTMSAAHGLDLACENAPRLHVLAGPSAEIAALEAECRTGGIPCTRLATTRAFHSRSMAAASAAFAQHLAAVAWLPAQLPVVSSITGRALDGSDRPATLLAEQLVGPVRFGAAVAALGPVDLVLEVGAGPALAALVQANGAGPVCALGIFGESAAPLLLALAAAWVLGAPLRRQALFQGRLLRPCRVDERPLFLANPCGLRTQTAPPLPARPAAPEPLPAPIAAPQAGRGDALLAVRQVVSELTGLGLAGLTPELRLLSDLHFNSIRARHALALAARRLGVERLPFDLTRMANASLQQAAATLEALRQDIDFEDEAAPPGVAPWLRLFAHDWVDVDPAPPRSGAWPGPLALLDALAPLPAASLELLANRDASSARTLLLTLPAAPSQAVWRSLLDAARRLGRTPGCEGLLVLQRAQLANAFLRSVAAELPQRRCCAVQVQHDDAASLQRALAEFDRLERGYSELRLCGARSQRRVLAPATAGTGGLPWQPTRSSTIVVSGGARGIGAASALALAREYRCAFALVGRSSPDAPEVAGTLAALRALGSAAEYFCADLGDRAAARRAVDAIGARLGAVDALIHCAGINRPTSVATLGDDEFAATLAAKLDTLEHLLDSLPRAALRLVLGYGSIIGELGLAGEAHYALANEWLQHRLTAFAQAAPQCRVLTIGGSAWREVGMAARLEGVLDGLQRGGTRALASDEATQALLQILRQPLPTPVVVAGRHGRQPDPLTERRQCQGRRYLERLRVHYPGIELVADAELCSDGDRYLQDHAPFGVPVLPLVCAIEAMVSAAHCLWQSSEMPVLEELQVGQALSCANGQRFVLRTAALVDEDGSVQAELRSGTTGFEVRHFSARLRKASGASLGRARRSTGHESLQAGELLYRGLCFHGPRLQRLGRVRGFDATHCEVETRRGQGVDWVGPLLPQGFAAGDPGLRDAAVHALQLCVPQQLVLPVGVARIELAALDPQTEYRIDARQRFSDGRRFVFDLEVCSTDGIVVERWSGLELRLAPAGAAAAAARPELAPALLRPLLARIASDVLGEPELFAGVVANSNPAADSRQALEQALGRSVALRRRADGALELDSAQASSSHGAGLTVALARPHGRVAVDLQSAPDCSLDDWRLMLGPARFELATRIAAAAPLPLPQALLVAWAASECLVKLGHSERWLGAAANPRVVATQLGPLVVFEADGLRLAALALVIAGVAEPAALALGLEDRAAPAARENAFAEGQA